VWLDEASSRQLVAQPSAEAAHLATLAANNAKRPMPVDATLTCPVCSEPLGHHDFPNAKLRLDVCTAHGTWFDRGELAVLVALVQEEHRRRDELKQAIRSASIDVEIRQVKDIYSAGYSEGHARGSRFRR
jgi:Zn-finger nucleic acid-binding protein